MRGEKKPLTPSLLLGTNKRQERKQVLGDAFEMPIAFSREGPKKVYVQHLLKERAEEINQLLEKKACIYVCGDAANMAREVNAALAQIISEQRGIPEAKAEEIVKNMRASNQYQVCVCASGGAAVALGNPISLTWANKMTGGCVVVGGAVHGWVEDGYGGEVTGVLLAWTRCSLTEFTGHKHPSAFEAIVAPRNAIGV